MNKLKTKVVFAQGSGNKDGVAQYAKQICKRITINDKSFTNVECKELDLSKLWLSVRYLFGIFRDGQVLHMQYPVESWGSSILPGIVPAVMRLILAFHKPRLVVTLHEWSSMHPLRMVSIIPLIVMSDELIFVSKRERKAFQLTWLNRLRLSKKRPQVIPIGVNLNVPDIDETAIKKMRKKILGTGATNNEIIFGFFGFIYSWKQPYALMAVLEQLINSGKQARLIFAGDFPEDHSEEKKAFLEYITRNNLTQYVNILGYVEDEIQLSNIIRSCNVVVLPFIDGLTSRRGSFWYALELGVPLITTPPPDDNEFEASFIKQLINDGRLTFVKSKIDVQATADLILSRFSTYHFPIVSRTKAPRWDDIVDAHLEIYETMV